MELNLILSGTVEFKCLLLSLSLLIGCCAYFSKKMSKNYLDNLFHLAFTLIK